MKETVRIVDLKDYAGECVTLRGWVQGLRSSGKLIFVLLREGTGSCQCIVEAAVDEAFAAAQSLTLESSLELSGTVKLDERAQGGVELTVESLRPIQIAEEYPISRKAHGVDFLMHHRHLWLRSHRQRLILRIRHTIIKAVRDFFDGEGFTLIDTPIITPDAAEGAGTLFALDYFGEQAYLAQTGQLYLESAAMALEKVYCFGPTFRAEKSKTRRHLTEFWMVEPEIAFAELDDLTALAEDMTVSIIERVLAKHREDLLELGRDVAQLELVKKPFPRLTYSAAVEMLHSQEIHEKLKEELARDERQLGEWRSELADLQEQLRQPMKKWKQSQAEERVAVLAELIRKMELSVENRPQHIADAAQFEWGRDLGGDEETILSKQYDSPLFITEYPRAAKAFYMKRSSNDPRVVLNLDMLAPEGYGEIIGGSQREDDIDALMQRIESEKMDAANYQWYLDLRRFGSVPHGGFGLGIERTVSWICGLHHVRETIPFPRLMGRIYP
jgi:asparaginyl-tRNA synthetase